MNLIQRLFLGLAALVALLTGTQSESFAQCGYEIAAPSYGTRSMFAINYVAGCTGSSNTRLYVLNSGTATYQWQYKASASGSFANITGATNVNHLPAASGYYRAYVSKTSCSSYTDSVEVLLGGATIPVTITPSSTISCSSFGSVKLSVLGLGGDYNFKWYRDSVLVGSDSVCFATATGKYHCIVDDKTTTCSGFSAAAQVMLGVAAPLAPSPVDFCRNTTARPLSATGSNLKWYTAATGGTASLTAPTPATATVRNDTFYVSQTLGSCESPRARIVVQIRALPPAPVPAPAQPRFCPGDTLRLSATSAVTRGRIDWKGPGGFADTGASVRRLHGSMSDTGHYLVRVTDTFGCVSAPDSVHLVINCPDPVWPGDVNLDKTVDHFDVLALALAFGNSGAARADSSIRWQPEVCAPWNGTVPGYALANGKHADCDGTGTVDYSDTLAITANYNLTHPKQIRNVQAKIAGVPALEFDLSGLTAVPGQTLLVPVLFGNTTTPAPAIAGIAASLQIEGIALSGTPQLSFSGSWLTGPAMLQFSKARSSVTLDWVYARTDRTMVSGSGHFASVQIPVPAAAAGSMLKLHFDKIRLVDDTGAVIMNFQALDDSIRVAAATGVEPVAGIPAMLQLIPNPASGTCMATVSPVSGGAFVIEMRDLSGRLVRSFAGHSESGTQAVKMPLQISDLGAGLYFLQLRDATGMQSQPVKWIRL